jgi:small subunit ribosomal protein S1
VVEIHCPASRDCYYFLLFCRHLKGVAVGRIGNNLSAEVIQYIMTTTIAELQQLIAASVKNYREGSIVKGHILEKRPKEFLIDIGYKSEGVVSASEFDNPEEINVGDEVEVLLERLENDQGMVVLSKQKASQRQNWSKIVKLFEAEGIIKGRVKSVVKGGLIVNVGVEAFLPASQVDINPPKDLTQFVGNTYDFKIVKINEDRKNVVLSRRELIEAERSERRQQFLGTMSAGDKVEGTVKNITDFGAFLDLDGIDGLLHITDMSWARLSHPSEAVKPGDRLTVVVLEINKDKERISLGLKQLQSNPWDRLEERFPIGQKIKGKVTNLMPYGAFVQIEEGIEGLIHVSELSWTKRITRPSDVLTLGQDIEAVVLGVNKEDQKISLGVRQLEPNPWDEIEQRYVIGKQVRGQVRNMTAYGAFVELEEGIDGMVHVSDLSWTKKINHPSEILKKGDEIDAVVIDIDKANQRISLGVKQIETDPWKEIEGKFKVGDVVKGTVSKIANFGAFIELPGDIDGLVHISQISEDRVEKVKDVLKPGQEVEARVIKIDKTERRLGLSIKATGYSEEALRKESEALESVKSGEDMVSFGAALTAAEEEYRPGQGTK